MTEDPFQTQTPATNPALSDLSALLGERAGRVRDPLGNIWWLHERRENVDPDEMARRYAQESLDREMKHRSEAESRTDASR